jgi:hypothetical protein
LTGRSEKSLVERFGRGLCSATKGGNQGSSGITEQNTGALRRTAPRCKGQKPVSPEDAQALKELDDVVKALKANQ